jgi:superfamily I DNA/RNA helicase
MNCETLIIVCFKFLLRSLFLSEKLKSENDVQKVSKDSRLRLLLVGPSRSKERLHIYYSRSSVFIDRLSGVRELVNYQVYPDDY